MVEEHDRVAALHRGSVEVRIGRHFVVEEARDAIDLAQDVIEGILRVRDLRMVLRLARRIPDVERDPPLG
ncbi:hypothetical protein D3C87_2102880 [compost metagenome]